MFRLLKADRRIPNKRGRIPVLEEPVDSDLPDFRIMTRFVGKVGLEALAHERKL
jgi:hypothetical protein